MLSDLQIDEMEFIFRLIDDGHLPDTVTIDFLDWLKAKDIERFALLIGCYYGGFTYGIINIIYQNDSLI